MKKDARRVHSFRHELVAKSREAALSAVQVFNNPLIQFKSESFIVLMIIAWTYMLHAFYRGKRIEYRYFEQGKKRRRFSRTKRGAFKYWELERCLKDATCPLDKMTVKNLMFLIGLRNEIEHQMTLALDNYLSGRYQACCLNYNRYIKELFGKDAGIERYLTYSLQFVELSQEQAAGFVLRDDVPNRLRAYVADFDSSLSEEEFNSPSFAYRLLFKKKVVGKPGQADKVVEFIDSNSELAQTIDKQYWVKKEVERKKFLPSEIVALVKAGGYARFGMTQHSELWKVNDAKNPGRGFGCLVSKHWYWYETWVDFVRQYCSEAGARYR